ncbi:hypothetical protein [Microbispora siamensis]|uniref:hypothetical protein n=1 Tax=Microbispora siamensis TaxID=564413 RepID=UPI0019507997|nr:hypothetical protein [Microbispora siamensis]
MHVLLFDSKTPAYYIGRPPEQDLRTIMNAILYVAAPASPGATSHTTTRREPPSDWYFAAWRDAAIFTRLSGLLHRLVAPSVTSGHRRI